MKSCAPDLQISRSKVVHLQRNKQFAGCGRLSGVLPKNLYQLFEKHAQICSESTPNKYTLAKFLNQHSSTWNSKPKIQVQLLSKSATLKLTLKQQLATRPPRHPSGYLNHLTFRPYDVYSRRCKSWTINNQFKIILVLIRLCNVIDLSFI